MSETLERRDFLSEIDAEQFARPGSVAGLAAETFSLADVNAALAGALPFRVPASGATELFSRIKIRTIFDRPPPPVPAVYHLLDVYGAGLFITCDRAISAHTRKPAECRAALAREIIHLMWGTTDTPAAATARMREFSEAREKAIAAGRKKQSDRFIAALDRQRRQELIADVFSAPPHVWARDPDRHFIAILRQNVTVFVACLDRRGPAHGSLDRELLASHGFSHALNLTRAFGAIDAALAKIVAGRNGRELAGAD